MELHGAMSQSIALGDTENFRGFKKDILPDKGLENAMDDIKRWLENNPELQKALKSLKKK